MKTLLRLSLLLLACTCSLGVLQASERYSIVKVYDQLGESEDQVLSQSEIRELQQEILLEARFHMLAINQAAREWDANEEDGSFPKSSIQRRRFIKTATYPSHSDAMDVVRKREENSARFAEKKAEREKSSKNKNKNKSSNSSSSKDRDAKKAERAEARMKRKQEALEYYSSAMDNLKQEAAEKAAEKE